MILKRLLFIATAIAVVAADAPAKAPKMTKEQEKVFDDVTVTLKNGDVERGKVTSYWNKTVGKTLNQDFKMKTDDGRELKLTYEDIDSICFPNRIKGYIKTWRVYNVATPKLGKKNAVSVWISGEGERSAHARIIAPSTRLYVKRGFRDVWTVYPLPCLKLDNDSVAYPFYYEENGGFNLGVMKHWMRKNNPELFDHIEQWFKADKRRKKEVPDRWAIMLDAVEDFYNTHTSNEQQ